MKLEEKEGIKKVKLTDDPLTNIKVMAPLLNERQQENVCWLIIGLTGGVGLVDKGKPFPYQ